MDQKKCPLCGSDECQVEESVRFGFFIRCKTYDVSFHLSDDIYADYEDKPEFNKLMNLIVEKTLRKKKASNNAYWVFYCDPNEESSNENPEFLNLAPLLTSYPITFMEQADRALLNLSIKCPHYGDPVTLDYNDYRLFLTEPDNIRGMLFVLEDLGYIRHPNNGWFISAEGWKHIEELRKKHAEVKQGFIAMSFKPEAESIRQCFKTAITEAGYAPMIIDEKEHNHQIVPELLKEIEKSKFLVLDVTYPNYGAYYEAGYALALGKEVIICCDNKVFSDDRFERPHFDIAQASQIRWSTEDELVERLIKRIKATVRE